MTVLTPIERPRNRRANRHAHQSPEYRAQWDRVQELQGKLAAIERQIEEQHNRIARHSSDLRRARAEALADGLPEPAVADLPPSLAALYEDRHVHEDAIARARRRLDAIEAESSRAICREVRPEYVLLVAKLHAAAAAFQAAVKAEEAFVLDLIDGGTRFVGLDRHNWNGAIYPEAIEQYAADAREFFPEINL